MLSGVRCVSQLCHERGYASKSSLLTHKSCQGHGAPLLACLHAVVHCILMPARPGGLQGLLQASQAAGCVLLRLCVSGPAAAHLHHVLLVQVLHGLKCLLSCSHGHKPASLAQKGAALPEEVDLFNLQGQGQSSREGSAGQGRAGQGRAVGWLASCLSGGFAQVMNWVRPQPMSACA